MGLKFAIGSVSLKCWGRIIHTMVAASESDIHFRFTTDSLTLSTFDSNLSICCICKFDKAFFDSYNIEETNELCCKVPSKCLLKPFKSLRFLQKCPDACEIEFEPETNVLTILIPCKSGIQVRYKLNFLVEMDPLAVEFDDESLQNYISVHPKFILKSLANFTGGKGVADLTLNGAPNKLVLKNCVNDSLKKEGKVYTELVLNPVDFSEYTIEQDCELTFPMREFKSFVQFAEYTKTNLTLHFGNQDEPVIVKAYTEDTLFTATLMMATKSLDHGRTKTTNKSSTHSRINNTHNRRKPTTNTYNQSNLNISTDFANGTRALRTDPPPFSTPPPPSSAASSATSKIIQYQNERTRQSNVMYNDDDMQESENVICSPSMLDNSFPRLHGMNDERDVGEKRMKSLFPTLGRTYDPAVDIPGFNEILVEGSDDEES